ncbi:MAG: hypothetical protein V1808_05035 [Candidatus Daviesbacteria bacterium]
MIVWPIIFLLFSLVMVVSLVLAFRSMSDYQERPLSLGLPYALYLVQKPEGLTTEIINRIHEGCLLDRLIISLERLFRGERTALVIFGPTKILRPLSEDLGLLEIEDYSLKVDGEFSAWEMGIKKEPESFLSLESFLKTIPALLEKEQIWWQLVLQPIPKIEASKTFTGKVGQFFDTIFNGTFKKRLGIGSGQETFRTALRVFVSAQDKKKVAELEEEVLKIGKEAGLVKLPQAYSSEQMLKFYQEKVMPKIHLGTESAHGVPLIFEDKEIKSLLGL